MVPSVDCAASSLLCAEDNSIFYDDDAGGGGIHGCGVEDTWEHRNSQMSDQNQSFFNGEALAYNGLPLQSEDHLTMMVKKECEHLPASDYLKRLRDGELNLESRTEAIDWIKKVQAYYNFGPLSVYLSVNYLDRFLSAYELPEGKSWTMQLLAVACLSLAAKIEETEVPLSLDLQVGEPQFVFEAKTIQRMELIVLSTLKWRMQAVTPFSFIDYFLTKINGDQSISRSAITKSMHLILSTTRDIDFLEFKPSEIAAAVAISATGETQTLDNEKAMAALVQHVEKEKVIKCVEAMKDLEVFVIVPSFSMPSALQSPVGVLDASWLSYKTDDETVESSANSSHNSSPIAKRRKLNRPCEVQL